MASARRSNITHFSASERRGIRVLVVLCLLSACFNQYVPAWVSRKQIAKFERDNAALLAELRSGGGGTVSEVPVSRLPMPRPAHDSAGTAAAPKPDRAYQEKVRKAPQEVRERPAFLRINTADAAELIRTGLVEPVIARRIVRFREGLGGFLHAGQLADVYGLTDSVFRAIADRVVVDSIGVRTINVNTATAEELMAHPYIHKGLANQIVNYRNKAGPYSGPEELLKLYFMDGETLNRLSPYIRTD